MSDFLHEMGYWKMIGGKNYLEARNIFGISGKLVMKLLNGIFIYYLTIILTYSNQVF